MNLDDLGRAGEFNATLGEDRHQARTEGLELRHRIPDFADSEVAAGLERDVVILGAGETVVAPDGSEGRILVEETWNTRILDELEPHPGDPIVSKHRYSGFFETELHEVLQGLNATCLVVTGCTTSICVESTVRDAMFRDYTCLVLEDCTAEPLGSEHARTNHEASLLNIEALFGWVTDSSALIASLTLGATLVATP